MQLINNTMKIRKRKKNVSSGSSLHGIKNKIRFKKKKKKEKEKKNMISILHSTVQKCMLYDMLLKYQNGD